MVKPVSKPTVTDEEQKFRAELYPDVKIVKNKNILCTSCNGSLKELILKGKPRTHPFMDTLLCEKCNSFFGDGEFSVDEDGSDKYCRWCGQGGTLYLCSTCTAGFCKKCIKRNLPRAALKEVEEDDWQCFCCNVKPLYELRAHCWAANKFSNEFVHNEEGKKRRGKKSEEHDDSDNSVNSDDSSRPRKRQKDDSDKEDEEEEQEEETITRRSKRGKKLHEETKVKRAGRRTRGELKIYKNVVGKLKLTIKDSLQMADLFKKKMLDCSNKKINLQYLKNFKNVEQTCEKLDTLLESVESISLKLRTSIKTSLKEWKQELVEESDEKDTSSEKTEEDIEKERTGSEKTEEDYVRKDRTVNGIDVTKLADDDDRLMDETKNKQDASDESENVKITTEQDSSTSTRIQKETSVTKTNDSDSDDDGKEVSSRCEKANVEDDDSEDRKISNNSEISQKFDDEEKSGEEITSQKRKMRYSSDEDDSSSKESHKKLKEGHGDN